jgi:transcriptional regulator with XRE-family HTH domain
MNEAQTRIAALQVKGWTLAAIADEVELTVNAVEKWKAGVHSPNKATLAFLDELLTRKRIPKKRRYHHEKKTIVMVSNRSVIICKGKYHHP